MSFRFLFAASLVLVSSGAQAQRPTDDDGCWNARSAGTGKNCLTISKHDWNGEIIAVRYRNGCSQRIFVRTCHERTDKSKDCHEYAISGNSIGIHKTGSANGEVVYKAVGSINPAKDSICANRFRLRR